MCMSVNSMGLPVVRLVSKGMRKVELACTSASKEEQACFFVLFVAEATSIK